MTKPKWRTQEQQRELARETERRYRRTKKALLVRKLYLRMRRELSNAKTIYQRNWRKANREKDAAASRKWRNTHKDIVSIHAKLRRAVRNGIVTKSAVCEECKRECLTQGHHPDYSKPLEVVWLCPSCHGRKKRK